MSLRERLSRRGLPTATFGLRVEDDSAAQAELAAARESGDPERITAAEDALAACYEVLTLTALSPVDWEALVAEHPPTEEQQAKGAWWNHTTFLPALLAACIDGDETAADWDYFLTKCMSLGESNALINAVLALNQRNPDVTIPKGSTRIPS